MSFSTYKPQERLRPFVKSFSLQESPTERVYTVLPGSSVVLGFQYRGRLSYLEKEAEQPLSVAGITGLLNNFRIFKNEANTRTALVNFTETGAAYFFKAPMHELFNGSFSLDDLIPRFEKEIVVEKLSTATNNEERIKILEAFLISRLSQKEADLLAVAAVTQIKVSNGLISISKLADDLNISQSRLEKRFRAIVGASPKKFSSIVRLQYIIKELPKTDSLTSLAYDAGYFDQAHFIKDFKAFAGQTPQQFLNK